MFSASCFNQKANAVVCALAGQTDKPVKKGVALMQTLSPAYIANLNRMHYIWGFPHWQGNFFEGHYNKDYIIFGSILESTHFGQLPYGRRRPSHLVKPGSLGFQAA